MAYGVRVQGFLRCAGTFNTSDLNISLDYFGRPPNRKYHIWTFGRKAGHPIHSHCHERILDSSPTMPKIVLLVLLALAVAGVIGNGIPGALFTARNCGDMRLLSCQQGIILLSVSGACLVAVLILVAFLALAPTCIADPASREKQQPANAPGAVVSRVMCG